MGPVNSIRDPLKSIETPVHVLKTQKTKKETPNAKRQNTGIETLSKWSNKVTRDQAIAS